jgi:hypothetical protein
VDPQWEILVKQALKTKNASNSTPLSFLTNWILIFRFQLKGDDTVASFLGEWQKLYKNSKHRSNENKTEPAKQIFFRGTIQVILRNNIYLMFGKHNTNNVSKVTSLMMSCDVTDPADMSSCKGLKMGGVTWFFLILYRYTSVLLLGCSSNGLQLNWQRVFVTWRVIPKQILLRQ